MANNISISDRVDEMIETSISKITDLQADANTIYTNQINELEEFEGKTADAIRNCMEEEKKMAEALCATLTQFAESVRFAAGEFKILDETGASNM